MLTSRKSLALLLGFSFVLNFFLLLLLLSLKLGLTSINTTKTATQSTNLNKTTNETNGTKVTIEGIFYIIQALNSQGNTLPPQYQISDAKGKITYLEITKETKLFGFSNIQSFDRKQVKVTGLKIKGDLVKVETLSFIEYSQSTSSSGNYSNSCTAGEVPVYEGGLFSGCQKLPSKTP